MLKSSYSLQLLQELSQDNLALLVKIAAFIPINLYLEKETIYLIYLNQSFDSLQMTCLRISPFVKKLKF